jgi:hypothetical protein
MKPILKNFQRSLWVDIAFLALISALTYLANVLSRGYYRDDWYYMYDGLVAGPEIFKIMFLHLRPARGPFFAFLFSLFGNSPLPYHLTLYLWRLLGGLAFFWLFGLLWPKYRSARFFTALMFIIYPGFLWWVAGVEYQPIVFSLGLHVFSMATTVKMIQTDTYGKKILWFGLSLLTGWYALALVDYAIGMEAFRFMIVYLLVQREPPHGSKWRRLVDAIKVAAPFFLIPLAFLLWRQVFLENWRKATDIGIQLGALFSSVNVLIWWLIYLMQSTLNVSVFAWGMPFVQLFFANRLRDMGIGMVFMVGGLVVALFADYLFSTSSDRQKEAPEQWTREAIVMGLLGTIAGVLPVVLGNRSVSFGRFSHYALPASIAGVILLTGLVFSLKDQVVRKASMGLVISMAILTHQGLSAQVRTEMELINTFWWQMSWRAPDLRSGALLLVNYPFDFSDDVDVVYGPANFIYYPEQQPTPPVELKIGAEVVGGSTAVDVLMGKKERSGNYYGAHEYYISYDNVLIISQPSANACLRVFDPRWTNFSIYDRDWLLEGASKSNIDNIILSGSPHLPPAFLFGPEPEHDWCYFFEKADLARQAGDWEAIVALHKEAVALKLSPNDQIELMPFLQAYAYQGDNQAVKKISSIINSEKWYKYQACRVLRGMSDQGFALQPEMSAYVEKLFCE